MSPDTDVASARAALRDLALGLPEAAEEFPWGDRVVKVRGKIFVFLGRASDGDGLSVTVKLPASRDYALDRDFAAPTGYGLGRAGWVTCRFAAADPVPLDLLKAWLHESYRAVAPKKLSALLSTAP
jgi:predicted DNA-binding protein (MmcQ/YjbR family)